MGGSSAGACACARIGPAAPPRRTRRHLAGRAALALVRLLVLGAACGPGAEADDSPAMPAALGLEPGRAVEYARRVDLHLSVEAERGGTITLTESASVEARFRVVLERIEEPDLILAVAFSELALAHRFEYAHDTDARHGADRWALPRSAAPFRVTLRCDRRGRVLACEGAALEAQAARIGAGRLARLVAHVFGARVGPDGRPGPDGPLAGSAMPLLAGATLGSWTVDAGTAYGLRQGLLDAPVLLEETWSWQLVPVLPEEGDPEDPLRLRVDPDGKLRLAGVLGGLASADRRSSASLSVSGIEGSASAVVDAKTGLPVDAVSVTSFAFEGRGKDEDTFRGTLSRRDRLGRHP